MSFYKEEGTSANVFEFLEKFKMFIETNANLWAVNGYDDFNPTYVRRGKKLSISKDGLYFNFNSTDYAYPISKTSTTNTSSSATAIQYPSFNCAPSRGYDADLEWYKQPGYLSKISSSGANCYSIIHDSNVTNNYKFMISDDQNLIIIINEFNSRYFYQIFGNVNQDWQYSGEGIFICSSFVVNSGAYGVGLTINESSNSTSSTNPPLHLPNSCFFNRSTYNSAITYNYIKSSGTVPTLYEQKDLVTSMYDSTSSTSEFSFPKFPKFEIGNICSYNNFNENSILYPIDLYVNTAVTGYIYRKAANLTDIYCINFKSFEPNEIFQIGTDNYLAIPFYKKENPQNYSIIKSAGFGLAIKLT